MNSKKYKVLGMTCVACVARVEKIIKSDKSVSSVTVNLALETVRIDYENSLPDIDNIKKKLKRSGYKLSENLASNKSVSVFKTYRLKLLLSLIFTIPLFYLSMSHMIYLPTFINPISDPILYSTILLIILIPIIIIGYRFYYVGFRALFLLSPNMDSLVAVSTTSAFIYSLISYIGILNGNHHLVHSLYFESIGMIISLILLGKTLESFSKSKANNQINMLLSLQPTALTIYRNGSELKIEPKDLEIDDVVHVKSGETIPIDGVIIDGQATIDNSFLTGESLPVDKGVGAAVFAGSININGFLVVKATSLASSSMLSKIINRVEEAIEQKAPIAKLADNISKVFVPSIILIAILSFIIWFIISKDFSKAIEIFIAVLTIACPCTLGLATPIAIVVGTGLGAKHGILFKNGEAIESLSKSEVIIFDKTGTLTKGKLEIEDMFFDYHDISYLKAVIKSLEMKSNHPLATSITKAFSDYETLEITDFNDVTGRGIIGSVDNKLVYIGSKKLMDEHKLYYSSRLKEFELNSTVQAVSIYIAIDKVVLGALKLSDQLKEDSIKTVSDLRKLGYKTVLLTGDSKEVASIIGVKLQIDEIVSEVLPIEKAQIVSKYQEKNKVLMIGDGINDSIALTKADSSISLKGSSDIALESSSSIILNDNIYSVVTSLKIAKRTYKTIKQNLFFAFIYNSLGIPVAAGVLGGLGIFLNPVIGALAMSLSSVSVILNALRLNISK